MNIVRELRRKMGIQQKELAIEIGVSQPTVSDWEANKKDPKGENLKKLALFFNVDELTILGVNVERVDPISVDKRSGKTETDQIINYLLERLKTDPQEQSPKTDEAKILAKGIDKLPKAQREQALSVVRAMFVQYAEYFDGKEIKDDDSKL